VCATIADLELETTHRPRLRALKADRHRRRCFIVGNGPSLAGMDLTRLKAEATFATDRFYLRMPELDWSPTYYVVDDHQVAADNADRLAALSGTTKLFAANLADALSPNDDTIFFDHRPGIGSPGRLDFSFDADAHTYAGGTVTFTCMQLAAYLGYQEIYLVGVDADEPAGQGMLAAFAEARRATEARGVSIVNATVGGGLEVFPRADFEMLFRREPAERLLVIDHARMGNGTATGEVKAAILGSWPEDNLMQLYAGEDEQLRIEGGPGKAEDGDHPAERIAAFDPDLVLYRPVPETEVLHAFAMDLIERTRLPLAIWIVDDWPSAEVLRDPVAAARLDADFRWLLARADARFSISPAMSTAFHERYGHAFVPIANGIDPADWSPARLRPAAPVKVRYAGSLTPNMTLASVGLVAAVVEQLAEGGTPISLEIKSRHHWRAMRAPWMDGLRHTRVESSEMSIGDYRRWLAEADILLIAYNFDAQSRDYIRYSLANKLPECLASGAAILAVGPDDVGTIATLVALGAGERVTVPAEKAIGDALRRLAASPEARFENARRAQEVAFALFDIHQTRTAFDSAIGRVAAAHRAGDYPRDLHAHVDETAVVASLLGGRRGSGHVMLDVGAHTGSSAAHFNRLGWTIHCFEPHPASRATLAERFAGRANLRIDPRAIGDAEASGVPLYDSAESSGITTLQPFHESHRAAAVVDVTTIGAIVDELDLSTVDFLKIDVEGFDLAVLRGVPWDRVRPDVIECEFEDAKTLALGHSWRDIGAFLRDRGYAVYVSEWHPIIRYGTRHDWRGVVPLGDGPEVDPAGWGNLLAFREDPGWPAVRRAFDRHIERGAGAQAIAHRPAPAETPADRLGRLSRRVAAGLWRRRSRVVPLAAVFAIWTSIGFVPALAPVAWLVWGSAALSLAALSVGYAAYRYRRAMLAKQRKLAKLRQLQQASDERYSAINAKVG
jgi:FkbM family methyltransferase